VEALVDVWTTLGLPLTEAQIIPLRRAAPEAVCTYPEMKRAAE
jgi:5-aminolevulinate synthase